MRLAIILLLLVFVPGLGLRVNGARRWIRLGFAGFQSVEAVKLMFIVYLASYLVRHRDNVQMSMFGVIKPLGMALILVALLLLQPDFGSARRSSRSRSAWSGSAARACATCSTWRFRRCRRSPGRR
jgi:cell division protein FtsW (lipid II flippase)